MSSTQDRRTRFEALAYEVAEPMRKYAARRADPDTAQDVVADALLVLWRRLDDVPEAAVLPWCYAVTRHCLANAKRAQRRQRGLVARIAMMDPPRAENAATETEGDPALHLALRSLSADDQELLRLWAWESLTPGEIAIVLGVSTNAASIRLHRARKRLAQQLTPPAGKIHDATGQKQITERRTP